MFPTTKHANTVFRQTSLTRANTFALQLVNTRSSTTIGTDSNQCYLYFLDPASFASFEDTLAGVCTGWRWFSYARDHCFRIYSAVYEVYIVTTSKGKAQQVVKCEKAPRI